MVRNRTAYASMDYSITGQYGIPHYCFPINGTNFYHSPKIGDVFNTFNNLKWMEDIANNYISDIMTSPKIDKLLNNPDTEKAYFRFENQLEDEIRDAIGRLEGTGGMLTVAQINKIFKKHPKLWKMYLKQHEDIMKSFYIYDGFHSDLNSRFGEIGLFGKPYYYLLNKSSFADIYKRGELYINDLPVKPGSWSLTIILFNAIKARHEISQQPKRKEEGEWYIGSMP